MKTYIGKTIKIKAGTTVNRAGESAKRAADAVVTVRGQKTTQSGQTRVYWKSNGVIASAIVK